MQPLSKCIRGRQLLKVKGVGSTVSIARGTCWAHPGNHEIGLIARARARVARHFSLPHSVLWSSLKERGENESTVGLLQENHACREHAFPSVIPVVTSACYTESNVPGSTYNRRTSIEAWSAMLYYELNKKY